MTEKRYDKLLGQLGVIFSIVVLGISIFFSSWGFSFDMNNYEWALVVSLALGASITVLQLVGNKDDGRDTVFRVIWILSYLYGIYTNVVGISQIRGGADSWPDYILPVLVGAFIEIVPEKLFLTSLRKLNSMKSEYKSTAPVTPSKPTLNPRDVRESGNMLKKPTSHHKSFPLPKRDPFTDLFGKDK